MTASDQRPGRLSVGIVGAGRVGSALGRALGLAGHKIVAAAGVSDTTRERVRKRLPGVPVLPVPEVVEAADLVLFTVPDDVLASLVGGIVTSGIAVRGKLVAHTSGRFGAAVLEPAT